MNKFTHLSKFLTYLFNGEGEATRLERAHAKIMSLASASLASAAAVAFSGIIGPIGLIVPHVKRQWQGVHYCQLSIISSAIALTV